MLLAEAITEKDYIETSILNLRQQIMDTLLVKDKTEFKVQKTLIDGGMQELKDMYSKYQQFSVTIQRAKAKAVIKVNDMELSILDAEAIKQAMQLKLHNTEILLDGATMSVDDYVVCLDVDELFKDRENIRLDIKTLESEINYAKWNVEVR